MNSLTILHRIAGNSQKFARINLGIKLISDSVLLMINISLIGLLTCYVASWKLATEAAATNPVKSERSKDELRIINFKTITTNLAMGS